MIVAVSVVVFFNPVWVAFEQDRTGVAELLGYTPEQVRTATNAILGEFVFGPGTFAVEVNGEAGPERARAAGTWPTSAGW